MFDCQKEMINQIQYDLLKNRFPIFFADPNHHTHLLSPSLFYYQYRINQQIKNNSKEEFCQQ